MQGKVVVITGATSGIGLVGAEQLAGMGARLVLVARDKARGDTALHRLRQQGPAAAHRVHYADLSRIADVKRVAGEIAGREPRIDVLVNNAGALFGSRRLTVDGLELTFERPRERPVDHPLEASFELLESHAGVSLPVATPR